MIDDTGNQTEDAPPSTAVEILGLCSVPQPGDLFSIADSEKEARQCLDEKETSRKEAGLLYQERSHWKKCMTGCSREKPRPSL